MFQTVVTLHDSTWDPVIVLQIKTLLIGYIYIKMDRGRCFMGNFILSDEIGCTQIFFVVDWNWLLNCVSKRHAHFLKKWVVKYHFFLKS